MFLHVWKIVEFSELLVHIISCKFSEIVFRKG
jgi:hypothetical protein